MCSGWFAERLNGVFEISLKTKSADKFMLRSAPQRTVVGQGHRAMKQEEIDADADMPDERKPSAEDQTEDSDDGSFHEADLDCVVWEGEE